MLKGLTIEGATGIEEVVSLDPIGIAAGLDGFCISDGFIVFYRSNFN